MSPFRTRDHLNGLEGSRGRLVAIEALRGLAALCVTVAHALGAAAALGVSASAASGLPWLAGVDVFFVISGFVIAHAAWDRFGHPGERPRFVVHRIARVVPLYWLVTTAFVVLALARPSAFVDPFGGWVHLLGSYLLLPLPRADGGVLPVFRLGWTLQYEALFYAVFALWIAAPRRLALAGTVASLAGLVALGWAWPAPPPLLAFWTDPILLEFGFGIGLAILHHAGVRVPSWTGLPLLAAGLTLLLTAGHGPRPLTFGLPATLLVATTLLAERPLLSRSLRRLALQAGATSYALYLSHLFVVRAVRELWPATALPDLLFVPAVLAASVLAAAAVHASVERPAVSAVRRLLDRAFRNRPARAMRPT